MTAQQELMSVWQFISSVRTESSHGMTAWISSKSTCFTEHDLHSLCDISAFCRSAH